MSIDFTREDQLRIVREKAYVIILNLLDHLTESERRYFLIRHRHVPDSRRSA